MLDRPTQTSQQLTDLLALRSARVLSGLGATLFPALGFLTVYGGFHEDVRLRYPIAAGSAFLFIGSYLLPIVRRHAASALMVVICAITAHNAYLVVANDLHSLSIVASLLCMSAFMATAGYTLNSGRQLALFLVFANACVLVACARIEHPLTEPLLFQGAHLTLTLLSYLAVSNQITTLQRLVQSQTLLERDIERRELVEAALRDSEQRAKRLLEAIPDVLLRVRRDGTVFETSNCRDHALGTRLSELMGRPLTELAESTESDVLGSALERAFATEHAVSASCSVRGSSRKEHAEIRAVATGSSEALIVVRDVTQEKALDERLRTSDRLVALGTLASGVAHEINNPLSYVAGNLSYAIDELETTAASPRDLSGAVSALKEAREGAERIGNIVAGLKQFSEPQPDKLAAVDLNETVHSALRMMKAQLSESSELVLLLEQVPRVNANATQLLQVLLNLLGNALQALPFRPKEQNRIRIKTFQAGSGAVAFELEDNGCGIPIAQQSRIFDPFFTTKNDSLRTGIGLYLCQRFVSSFGGEITVFSEPGSGARFRVTLREAAARPSAGRNRPAANSHALCVLIVDDEPLVARSVARMLRDCASTIASSGAEALELCKDREFDMILCDMMMPGMDGSEFFEALQEARPELAGQVVFMTGGAFTDQTTAFLANHANPWLQKPVRREWLVDAAEQLSRASVRLERANRVAGTSVVPRA